MNPFTQILADQHQNLKGVMDLKKISTNDPFDFNDVEGKSYRNN